MHSNIIYQKNKVLLVDVRMGRDVAEIFSKQVKNGSGGEFEINIMYDTEKA